MLIRNFNSTLKKNKKNKQQQQQQQKKQNFSTLISEISGNVYLFISIFDGFLWSLYSHPVYLWCN